MSREEALGPTGALQARWEALVNVLVDKGLVTREEIVIALDRVIEASLKRRSERAEEEGLYDDDDVA